MVVMINGIIVVNFEIIRDISIIHWLGHPFSGRNTNTHAHTHPFFSVKRLFVKRPLQNPDISMLRPLFFETIVKTSNPATNPPITISNDCFQNEESSRRTFAKEEKEKTEEKRGTLYTARFKQV